ncbi:unnamed protein product [Rotaria sp. Silwood2]|nr:unnamed protein product [Rotaria sp. Silwood2]CAF4258766.1 unnamed protein product [Rotaria sp. Silwood2]
MKLVTNFNHQNIIKYFDFEYEQGNAYLTMKYITGGNQILIDVARGMIYLNDRNIVQGDLKSHNILLRNENHLDNYGCIILETTTGRERWIDQFNDDAILFRALQRKENVSVFARICANEFGPSHICKLLIQCCAWSKPNRP